MRNPQKCKALMAHQDFIANLKDITCSYQTNHQNKLRKCVELDPRKIVKMERKSLFICSKNKLFNPLVYLIFISIMNVCFCAFAHREPTDLSSLIDSSSFKPPTISNSTECNKHALHNETELNREKQVLLENKAKSIDLPTVESMKNSSYLARELNRTLNINNNERDRKDLEDLGVYEPVDDKLTIQPPAKYARSAISSSRSPQWQLNDQDAAKIGRFTTTSSFSPTLKQLFDDDDDFDMMVSHNPLKVNSTDLSLGRSTNRPKVRINSKASSYPESFQHRSSLNLSSDKQVKPAEADSKRIFITNSPMLRVVSSNLSPKQTLAGQRKQVNKLSSELSHAKPANYLAGNKSLTRDRNSEASEMATILKFATFPQLYYDAIKKGAIKNRLEVIEDRPLAGSESGKSIDRKQRPQQVQDLREQQVVDLQSTNEDSPNWPYKTLTATSTPAEANLDSLDGSVERELSPFKSRVFHGGYWRTNNNNSRSYNKENDRSNWPAANGVDRKSSNGNHDDDYDSANNYSSSNKRPGEKKTTKSQSLKPILLKSDVKVRSELVFENNNNNSGIDGLADRKLSGSASKLTNSSSIRRLEATNDATMFRRVFLPAPIMLNMDEEKIPADDGANRLVDFLHKSYHDSSDSDDKNRDQHSTLVSDELVKGYDNLSNLPNNIGDYELLGKRDEDESYDLENKSNSWPYANYVAKPKPVVTKSNTASSGIRVTTGEGPTPLIINNNGLIVAAKHNTTGKPYNPSSLTNQVADHPLNPIKINGNINVYDENYSTLIHDHIERPTFLKKPLVISDTLWSRNSTHRPDPIKQTSYNLLSPIEQYYNHTNDYNASPDWNKHNNKDIHVDTAQLGDHIGSMAIKNQQMDERDSNKTQIQSPSFHHNPPYKHHLSSLNQRPANSDQQHDLSPHNSQANCTSSLNTTLAPVSLINRPKQNTRHPDQNRRTSPSPNQPDRISYELSTSQSQHQTNRFPLSSTSSLANGMSSTTPASELSPSSTTSAPIEFSSTNSSSANHHNAVGHGHNNHHNHHQAQHHHHIMTPPSILAQNSHPHFLSTTNSNLTNIIPVKPSKIRNKLQHIIIGKILKSQLNNSLATSAAAAFNQQMAASQNYLAYQALSTPPPLLSSTVANNVANLLAQKLNSLVRPYQPLSGLNSLLGIKVGTALSSSHSPQSSSSTNPQQKVINRFKQRINPFATQTHSSINRRTTGVGSLLMSGFVYGLTVLPALMALTGINPLSGHGGGTDSAGGGNQVAESSTRGNTALSTVTNRHGDTEKRTKRLNNNSILGPLMTDTDPLSSYAYLLPLVSAPAASINDDLSPHLSSETLSSSEPLRQPNIMSTIHTSPNSTPIGSNSLASNSLSEIHPLLDDPTIGQLSPTAAPLRFTNQHLASFASSPTTNHVAHYIPSASDLWVERVAPANRKHFHDFSSATNNYWQQQSQNSMDSDSNFASHYNLSEIRKPFSYSVADITPNNQHNLYNLDNFIGSSSSQEKQIVGRGNGNRISGNMVDNQHYLINSNSDSHRQLDNLNSNQHDNEIQQTTSAPLLPFIIPLPLNLHSSDSNRNLNQQQASSDQFSGDKRTTDSIISPSQVNQQQPTLQHALDQISMPHTAVLGSILLGNSQVLPIRSSNTLDQRQQVLLGLNDHHQNQNHLSNKRQTEESHQENTNFPTNNHFRSMSSKLEQQQRYQTNTGADNIGRDLYNSNNIGGSTISALNSIDNYLYSHRKRRTPNNFINTYRPSSGETELRPVIMTQPMERPYFRTQLLSTSLNGANLFAPTKVKLAKEKIIQKRPNSLSQLLANDRYQVGYTLNYAPITPSPTTQTLPSTNNTSSIRHQPNYLVPLISQNHDLNSNNKNWRAILPKNSQISSAKDVPFGLVNSLELSKTNKDRNRNENGEHNHVISSPSDLNNHWLVTGISQKSIIKPSSKITKFGNLKPSQERKRRRQSSQTTTELPIEVIQDREGESRLILSHAMAMGSKVLNEPVIDDMQR